MCAVLHVICRLLFVLYNIKYRFILPIHMFFLSVFEILPMCTFFIFVYDLVMNYRSRAEELHLILVSAN